MRLNLLRICTHSKAYAPKKLPNALLLECLATGLPSESRARASTSACPGLSVHTSVVRYPTTSDLKFRIRISLERLLGAINPSELSDFRISYK